MNLETLHLIMPRAPSIFVDPVTNAMVEFGISSPARQAMFLANLAHESGEFQYMEEIANGIDYENNPDLGNNLPEAKAWAPDGKAGPWFKGHGPIQITGYYNIRKMSIRLYDDPDVLLKNPKILCQPADGCRAAAAFFVDERCAEAADADNFLLCCQIINMAPRFHGTNAIPNGWEHRKQYYFKAKSVLAGA